MRYRLKQLSILGLLIVTLTSIAGGSYAYMSKNFEISKQVEVFVSLFKKLHNYYVDDINTSSLMKTGVDAMLDELDPYTKYIPESKIENYRMQTTGQYGGIGAVISQKGNYVQIIEPYKGFPADKADLRAGDIIQEVNGKSVKGKNTNQVSELLKGQPGTDVKVTIERPAVEDREITKSLKRQKVEMPNITYSGVVEGENVGYIKYKSFRKNSSEELRSALQSVKEKANDTLSGLILDLRGNPGGILNEAVKSVSWFIEQNELVVKTKGKIDRWNKEYRTTTGPVDTDIPMTVLVDGNSASASEIVSGALQDYDRAVILGQQTYGKGLVQQAKDLPYNAKVKLTIAKYYIPSGRCIQARDYSNGEAQRKADSTMMTFETENGRKVHDGDGITPDVKVSSKDYPKAVRNLLKEGHLFSFANQYRNTHDSIPEPGKFEITDKLYASFTSYLEKEDYEYETQTENKIAALRDKAKKEQYYQDLSETIERLEKQVDANKADDLQVHKTDIKKLLEERIVSRYYYRSGRIKASLDNDNYVQKSLEVLNDPERYREILKIQQKN